MKTLIASLILIISLFTLMYDQYVLPSEAISPVDMVKTGLPIISITAPYPLSSRYKRPGLLEIISADPTIAMGPYPIAIEFAGSTAVRQVKKRYSFQFSKKKDWLDGVNRSPLGLKSDDDWTLDAAFRDHLIFRNKLNHDLYNKIVGEKITLTSKIAEVYFNGEYSGLYVLGERADKNLYKMHPSLIYKTYYTNFMKFFERLSHKVKSSYAFRICRIAYRTPLKIIKLFSSPNHLSDVLYKANPGANFTRTDKYSQKYPHLRYTPLASNLNSMIKLVNEAPKEKFQKKIWKELDRQSTIDYLVLLIVNGGYDNMTCNYMLHYKNDRFYFRPWDLDGTFKSIDNLTDQLHAAFDHWPFMSNALYKRLFRGDDPQFLRDLIDKYFELRKSTISYASLKKMFLDNYKVVSTSGAIERDHKFWDRYNSRDELNQTLVWVKKRLAFVDAKLKKVRAGLLDK
ncbi:MAG: CotH kinase family protein [Bacteriovoracaceae bacterium]|nr:CotH kinase family protein [Bacteriovoracaceae bacterium]